MTTHFCSTQVADRIYEKEVEKQIVMIVNHQVLDILVPDYRIKFVNY